MKKLKSNLPNLIRQYLDDNQMTQKELSIKSGVPEGTLSRIMHSNPLRIDLKVADTLRAVIKFEPGELIIEEAS